MHTPRKIADIGVLLREGQLDYLPHVSVDSVIFSFHEGQLKVLLLKIKDLPYYGLPGGYVGKEEDLDAAAGRILEERTGIQDVYLEQCGTFGQCDRTGEDYGKAMLQSIGVDMSGESWLMQRFLSVGYYALVNHDRARPRPGFFDAECRWSGLTDLPPLIFDHDLIIRKALQTLRVSLDHKLIGSNLLSEMFTMSELQQLYESILGRPLLRANFQRKMLGLDILDRLDKKFGGGAHKAPYLYRFRPVPVPLSI